MKLVAQGEGFVKVFRMDKPEDFEKTDISFLDHTAKEALASYLGDGPLWTTSEDSWTEEEAPQEVEGKHRAIRVVSVVHSRVFVETHSSVENEEGVWVDDIAFC